MADLTVEQEDALILEELWIAEDDSTINDESEVEVWENEATEDEATIDETETETDSAEEEKEEEETIEDKKPKNKFAKLLAERNQARKLAEQEAAENKENKSKVSELNEKLKKFEEDWETGSTEHIEALVEKRIAEEAEKNDFFNDFQELKEYKTDILNTKNELNISLEQATKLYLAEHNPSLLLSPQAKAKEKSKMLNNPTRTSQKLVKGEYEYSDEEFAAMAKAGKIKF